MYAMRSTLKNFLSAVGLAALLLPPAAQAATGLAGAAEKPAQAVLPSVELFHPPVCLACIDWAEHLREAGFKVTLRETADMEALKKRLKVPADVESVHTAMVAGYFVEGHVPAEDVKQLLIEKPKARGIAVPGLPAGAPGRENQNPVCDTACTILDSTTGQRDVRREMFNTMLIDQKGQSSVFARH